MMPEKVLIVLATLWLVLLQFGCSCTLRAAPAPDYAEIHVIDDETERGIPLVELTTVHHLRFVTDNAGRIAIGEPGLLGHDVFFDVHSHGYRLAAESFGRQGISLRLAPGEPVTLRLERRNVAERIYRITGEGLYRDSVLLGHPTPLAEPLGSGKVAGQDSAFAVPYQDKLYWFWGDTTRLGGPLGHFWMAGATSKLPSRGGLDPALGINLNYFVDETGFSRPMCRLGVKEGLIWADGFATVSDDHGRERLVCHFLHLRSLDKVLGHGLAVYNDQQEKFERLLTLDLDERWRWPAQAHAIHYPVEGIDHLWMGEVYPTVRVPARLSDYTDPARYEAWTCLASGSTIDHPQVDRDASGHLQWSWRRDAPPVDSMLEEKLIDAGMIRAEEARGRPLDVDSGRTIRLHRGSVHWNAYRQRWIMIACELGGTSNLGEIWYSEAEEPTGPWRRAKKIVTHEQYSFYNPVHHPFFDQEQGRLIYFEGTYTSTFSGNQDATPRYDYNQIMYRVDLSNERLGSVAE